MKVFADTSAFLALFIKSESDNKLVSEKFAQYKKGRDQIFVSDYILAEIFTQLSYRFGAHALKFGVGTVNSSLESGELTMLTVHPIIFAKAKDMIVKYADQKLSFTDCTSYILFKETGLDEIFTLDTDFKKLRLPVSFPHLP